MNYSKIYNNYHISAKLLRPRKLVLHKTKTPSIDDSSVLVKVLSCSICGSDLKIFNNGSHRVKPNRVLGHEISGKIVEVGKKIKKFKIGDNISLGADISNEIDYAFGYEVDGGFAQFVLVNNLAVKQGPIQKFNKLKNFDLASLAEPLASCLNGYEKSMKKNNLSGKSLAIFGAGPIGLMLAILGKYFKAKKIFLIEKSKYRINFAKKNMKFTNVLTNINIFNLKKQIYKLNNNRGVDYIFTANSNSESHKNAFEIIDNDGVINLFGGLIKNSKYVYLPSNLIHYKQLKLVGSHGSTKAQHKKALRLIENKKLKLDFLITHKFKLRDIVSAFKKAKSGKSIKIVVKPNV